MRPMRLKRIIETVQLAESRGGVLKEELKESLRISERRVSELGQGVSQIGLISEAKRTYLLTKEGHEFNQAVQNGNLNEISQILVQCCSEYACLLKILPTNIGSLGLNFSQILKKTKEYNLTFNYTIVDNLIEWGRRLNAIQKNLYTSGAVGRYYQPIRKSTEIQLEEFAFEKCKKKRIHGRNVIFLPIPSLRENFCELFKLKRKLFDTLLLRVCYNNLDRMELTGTTLTSNHRKTPTGRLRIDMSHKESLFSPNYVVEREEGIQLKNRKFSFLAIYF